MPEYVFIVARSGEWLVLHAHLPTEPATTGKSMQGLGGREGWNQAGMGQVQKGGGISSVDVCQILTSFLGPINLLGSKRTCASNIPGAGTTSPTGPEGVYPAEGNRFSLVLRMPPEVKTLLPRGIQCCVGASTSLHGELVRTDRLLLFFLRISLRLAFFQ